MRILVTDGMDKTALETLRAKGHEAVSYTYLTLPTILLV